MLDLPEKIYATAVTGISGAVAVSSLNAAIFVPVLGVPVAVVIAAAAGAASSLGFRDPVEDRKELFWQTLASTFIGATFSILLSDGFGWDWAQKTPGAAAFATGLIVRLFFPTLIVRGKRFISEFNFSFGRKN